MKKIFFLILSIFLITQFLITQPSFAAVVGLDYMEYSTDALAQAAYVSSDAVDSNTKLLLHCDGTDASTTFTDSAGTPKTVTANGNAQIDTAQSKFGGASGLFDGDGDYLSIPTSTDFDFGSGNWTLDFWVSFNAWVTGEQCFMGNYTGSSTGFIFRYQDDIDILRITDGIGDIFVSWTASLNTWYHIAAVRSGSNVYFFVDGTQVGVTQTAFNFGASTGAFIIGRHPPVVAAHLNGWLDEIRVSKGVARWTANFTPPSAAYDNVVLQCYSEATIKQQGSYSLKGIAAITDSLNDTLTRTVSPTIDLTGQNQIKFDIRASRTGSNIKIGIHDTGGTTTELTPSISSANTFETKTWDISGVSDANKDAIDKIIITITNADAANTFYIDNIFSSIISPTVSTSDATDISSSQATLNGNITDTGGENALERGFDWGTSPGSYPYSWTETGSFGTGTFNHPITGLSPNTPYYFRAKARNSAGWGYGSEKSFTTTPPYGPGTNISSNVLEHWAWNDVVGWIDFYFDNVQVTSHELSGYASSSVGYIAFDCATSPSPNCTYPYEVSNDGSGNLSGWAWSEGIGWISFYCGDLDLVPPICDQFNYRVTIDGSGNFSGWAWNDVIGWISFNCNNSGIGNTCASGGGYDYKVKTSWVAAAATGTLLSSIFDTGVADGAAFNSIMWRCNATSTICQPPGTAVKFQFASATQSGGVGGTGPIDSTFRYAWNDSTGWWDFGYSAGNVSVSSTQLTGYAYNTNLAEISLDCATSPGGNVCGTPPYKVSRDSTTGDLSGWAWNDSIGWISFCGNTSSGSTWDGDKWVCPASPTYQVKVNPTTGVFTGWAWNDDVGWISFNCVDTSFGCTDSNYYVATSQTGLTELIGLNGTSLSTDTYNPTGPDTPVALNRLYHNNHRYYRYKIILESNTAQTASPRVDDVIVNWSP